MPFPNHFSMTMANLVSGSKYVKENSQGQEKTNRDAKTLHLDLSLYSYATADVMDILFIDIFLNVAAARNHGMALSYYLSFCK